MSNLTKFLKHVTLASQIFLEFSPVVGIIEIWKSENDKPLTTSISEFMVFLKMTNWWWMCPGWHFRYYIFFDNFSFKQPLVLKTHLVMFLTKDNSKWHLNLPKTYWFLSYRQILSKFAMWNTSVKKKDVVL